MLARLEIKTKRGSKMSKEEQFYTDRSTLLGKLVDYIVLCQYVERNVLSELEEIVTEAIKESQITNYYVCIDEE
jgi:hypothetical protein